MSSRDQIFLKNKLILGKRVRGLQLERMFDNEAEISCITPIRTHSQNLSEEKGRLLLGEG